MTVMGGSTGILVRNADNVTVAGNYVQNTSGDGIEFINSTRGTVTGNTVTDSGGDGIYAVNDTGMTILNNTVDAYGRYGIGSVNSTNVTIGSETADPTVFSNMITNGMYGVYVAGGSNVFVDKNFVTRTTAAGLFAARLNGTSDTQHGVKFFRNVVLGGKTGIEVNDSAYASVTNNRVGDVTGAGIVLDNDRHAQLNGNRVYNTGADGITVTGSPYLTAQFNRIYDTNGDAFAIDGSNNAVLTGNSIGSDDNGKSQGVGNVQGNGIVATNLRDITIQGNRIQQTASHDDLSGSGIRFRNVVNGLIGGGGAGQGNVITAVRLR